MCIPSLSLPTVPTPHWGRKGGSLGRWRQQLLQCSTFNTATNASSSVGYTVGSAQTKTTAIPLERSNRDTGATQKRRLEGWQSTVGGRRQGPSPSTLHTHTLDRGERPSGHPAVAHSPVGPSVRKTRPSVSSPSAHRREPGGDHLQGPSSIGPRHSSHLAHTALRHESGCRRLCSEM